MSVKNAPNSSKVCHIKNDSVSPHTPYLRVDHKHGINNHNKNSSVNHREIENFYQKKEISLAPTKTFLSNLTHDNYYSYSTYNSKTALKTSRNHLTRSPQNDTEKTYDPHTGRATNYINNNHKNASLMFLDEDSFQERKTDFKMHNKFQSPKFSPNRFTALSRPTHVKRKKVKNPLTHVPYNENLSDNSNDNFDLVNTEMFDHNEIIQHEIILKTSESERTDFNAPERGVESEAMKIDYDNIKLVYQNQEDGMVYNEKPKITGKKDVQEIKINYSNQSLPSINPKKTSFLKNNINMKVVKKCLDEIQESEIQKKEKWKRKYENNRQSIDDETRVNCLANQRCTIF